MYKNYPSREDYKRRWRGCKANAIIKNLEICSLDEMKLFWDTPHICAYCLISEEEWIKKQMILPGKNRIQKRKLEVDRKDSNKGYTLNNIVWACHLCNTIKNSILTYEEMKEIGIKYIMPRWKNAI